MKILYITEGSGEDYQRDILFHGLRSLHGENIVDVNPIGSMYESSLPNKNSLYGRGFTIYCNLPNIDVDRSDIENKIRNKFFDLIVFGSIHRCSNYYSIVDQSYPANKVACVDGEDRWGGPYNGIVSSKFPYFKRECDENTNTFPIQFGIPKEKVCINKPTKIRNLSNQIPKLRSAHSYQFNNEAEYYKEYQESCFAITTKKAGWDALRHYEIIANHCIPLFEDIENCPNLTLHKFPKKLCVKANALYNDKFSKMENSTEDSEYQQLLDDFISCIPNITTEAVATSFLDQMKVLQNK